MSDFHVGDHVRTIHGKLRGVVTSVRRETFKRGGEQQVVTFSDGGRPVTMRAAHLTSKTGGER